MSVSSRTLKESEMPLMHQAQIEAANQPNYAAWVEWMRDTFNYALAVRMAVFLGFKVPDVEFYTKMRQEGQQILDNRARKVKVRRVLEYLDSKKRVLHGEA